MEGANRCVCSILRPALKTLLYEVSVPVLGFYGCRRVWEPALFVLLTGAFQQARCGVWELALARQWGPWASGLTSVPTLFPAGSTSSSLCEHWVSRLPGSKQASVTSAASSRRTSLASLSESVEMTGERSEDDGGSGFRWQISKMATCGHAQAPSFWGAKSQEGGGRT